MRKEEFWETIFEGGKVVNGTIYCDIDLTIKMADDTINMSVVNKLKELYKKNCEIYLWSQAGARHCREVAEEADLLKIISGCLPKPDICIDDLDIKADFIWKTVKPNEVDSL